MGNTKVAIIRKESAVKTGELVKQQIGGLMDEATSVGVWLFGFDPTNPEHMEDVFRCDRDGTRDWTQHTTEPFLLRVWAAQKIHLPARETREASDNVRVILIDPAGDTLSFVSVGVVMSLDLIRALLGDGPFDPPIPVTVEKIDTGADRHILKLRPHLDKIGKVKK